MANLQIYSGTTKFITKNDQQIATPHSRRENRPCDSYSMNRVNSNDKTSQRSLSGPLRDVKDLERMGTIENSTRGTTSPALSFRL